MYIHIIALLDNALFNFSYMDKWASPISRSSCLNLPPYVNMYKYGLMVFNFLQISIVQIT